MPLPDRPLVAAKRDGDGFVFFDENGENLVTRRLRAGSCWTREALTSPTPGLQGDLTWSPDGTMLAGRLGVSAGYPVLIAETGRSRSCVGIAEVPRGSDRVWITQDMQVVTTWHGDPGVTKDRVVLYDMATCEVDDILFTAEGSWVGILDAALSAKGLLAVEQTDAVNGLRISIIGPDGEEIGTIPGAQCPAWSPDGSRLAYATEDGLYDAKPDGSDAIRRVERSWRWPSPVSWSPDGRWWVFADMEAGRLRIHKLNLANNAVEILPVEGDAPAWR